jgi:hypothetical protein
VGYLHDLIYGNLSRNSPRLDQAAAVLANATGYFLMEMEQYRAYYLVLTCSRLDRARCLYALQWFFIGTYLLTTSIIRLTATLGHDFGHIFDVLKAMYMKLIVDVHRMVFDADGRRSGNSRSCGADEYPVG